MNHRSRAWVTHRLRTLAALELLNIPLQYVVWFHLLNLPTTTPNLTGFALFALLLLEGALYWWLKLHRTGVGFFRQLRWCNVVLLTGGLVYTAWSVAQNPGSGTVVGLLFALAGVLEHINYFHVQLMYDTQADLRWLFTRGFRRSHLSRDLTRTTRVATAPGRPARYEAPVAPEPPARDRTD
ncbi:hypothetical protein [Kribbella solani]|uniref:Uncharacterized protein n=1 Tax=Kribbella solani TaxID=236067 RepID=A0A841DZD1_9ACTN|nr:hypothetical protein [Kribbella solani]MBB5983913.1 hypothetical protein [Kribbella solani]